MKKSTVQYPHVARLSLLAQKMDQPMCGTRRQVSRGILAMRAAKDEIQLFIISLLNFSSTFLMKSTQVLRINMI